MSKANVSFIVSTSMLFGIVVAARVLGSVAAIFASRAVGGDPRLQKFVNKAPNSRKWSYSNGRFLLLHSCVCFWYYFTYAIALENIASFQVTFCIWATECGLRYKCWRSGHSCRSVSCREGQRPSPSSAIHPPTRIEPILLLRCLLANSAIHPFVSTVASLSACLAER